MAQGQLNDVRHELDQAKNKAREDERVAAERVATLESAHARSLHEARRQLDEVAEHNKRLQKDLGAAQTAAAAADAKHTVAALTERRDQLQHDLEQLRAQHTKTERDMNAAQKERDVLAQRVADEQRGRTVDAEAQASAASTIGDLRARLGQASQNADTLQRALTQAERELAALRVAATHGDATLKASQQQVDAVQAELSQLHVAAREAVTREQALRSDMEALRVNLNSATCQGARLREQLEAQQQNATQQLQRAAQDFEQLLGRVAWVERQLADASSAANSRGAEVAQLTAAASQMRESLMASDNLRRDAEARAHAERCEKAQLLQQCSNTAQKSAASEKRELCPHCMYLCAKTR